MDHGRICCRILKRVYVVADIRKLGIEKGYGPFLSGGSFYGASDGN